MNILRGTRAFVTIALALAACSSKNNTTVDAKATVDARVCTAVTTGTVDFDAYTPDPTNPSISWTAPITGSLGDGNMLQFSIQFYGGIESSLAGTFDLSMGNQNNYSSCAICVLAFDVDSQGNLVKEFFQSAGSITLTQDPFTNEHMVASITGLQLQEVTVDQMSFASTPVAGGACTSFGSLNLDHDKVPNAWTCTHSAYSDGTSCNCVCGTPDPDCDLAAPPVVGCAAQQTCFQDACYTPPANDTCATATTLTIGTPVTGTTLGAARNYDSGLEGMGCTGSMQPGPDVAYAVTLAANQAITVTLSNLAAAFDGSISLVGPGTSSVCTANPITTCVKGADVAFEGQNETFQYTAVTAGTYYVIVDSFYTDEAGTFTLGVTSP